MSSTKRSHDGAAKAKPASTSPFMPMFEGFRDELDEHHDRRERVIKASRDITAASKKIIFALQRVRNLSSPLPAQIAKETSDRHAFIKGHLQTLGAELASGPNRWRYQRQLSGGLQEYIEALTLQHYLERQQIMTLAEAAATISLAAADGGDGGGPSVIILTPDDYLLGLFDLVGELMRFAITNMAITGRIPGVRAQDDDVDMHGIVANLVPPADDAHILTDMRTLRAGFLALDPGGSVDGGAASGGGASGAGGGGGGAGTGGGGGGGALAREMGKKMEVMKTCVDKVETAVYSMHIRGRERPLGWMPDLEGEVV